VAFGCGRRQKSTKKEKRDAAKVGGVARGLSEKGVALQSMQSQRELCLPHREVSEMVDAFVPLSRRWKAQLRWLVGGWWWSFVLSLARSRRMAAFRPSSGRSFAGSPLVDDAEGAEGRRRGRRLRRVCGGDTELKVYLQSINVGNRVERVC